MAFDPSKYGLVAAPEQEAPYVNEQHPDITFKDRFLLKNVGTSPEARARWLEENKGMETRIVDDAVQVRKPGEGEWRGLEARGKFELSDISDIGSDVTAGISTGLGVAAGGLLGLPAGPGAVAAGIAGGAAGAGLHEAGQQALASGMGMGEETLGGALKDIGKEAAFGAVAQAGGAALGGASRLGARALGGEAGEGLVGMGARKLMANLGRGRATQAAGETLQAPTRTLGKLLDARAPPAAKNARKNATKSLQAFLRSKNASEFAKRVQGLLVKEGATPDVRRKILADLARGTTTTDEVLKVVESLRAPVFSALKEGAKDPLEKVLIEADAVVPLIKRLNIPEDELVRFTKAIAAARELSKHGEGMATFATNLKTAAGNIQKAIERVLSVAGETVDKGLKKGAIKLKAKYAPPAAERAPGIEVFGKIKKGLHTVPKGTRFKALRRLIEKQADTYKAISDPLKKVGASNIGGRVRGFINQEDIHALTAIGRKALQPATAFMSVIGPVNPATARTLPHMIAGAAALGVPMAGPAVPVGVGLAGTHVLGGLLRSIGRAPSIQAKEKLLAAWLKKNAESPIAKSISGILKKRGVKSALAALYVRSKREEK
jgi:hypothetical protein